MGFKRPHSEDNGASYRKDAPRKRMKKHFHTHKPTSDGSTAHQGLAMHKVKRLARSIERRFAKGYDLPADVKQRLERELAQYKRQIGDQMHKKRRQEMISKYHKVRFFERKKAERLRKQLQKQLDEAADPEEKARIEADLHVADVDYHYTRYFPFLERYESLYAVPGEQKDVPDGESAAARALHAGRPPMWKVVEEAMQKGQAALEELQERRAEKTESRAEDGHTRETPSKPSKPSPGGKSRPKPEPAPEPAPEPKPAPISTSKSEKPKEIQGDYSMGNRRQRRLAMKALGVKGPAGDGLDGSGFFG